MFILKVFFRYDFRIMRTATVFPFEDEFPDSPYLESVEYDLKPEEIKIWTRRCWFFGRVFLCVEHNLPDEGVATKDGSILYSYKLEQRPSKKPTTEWKSIGHLRIPMS